MPSLGHLGHRFKGFRAPMAPEPPSSVWPEKAGPLRCRSSANSEAGPKGAGQDARSKERPPHLALAGHSATAPALLYLRHPCRRHARQVRDPGPGFQQHIVCWRKGIGIVPIPPRGLSSPPHRGTGATGRAAGRRGPHCSAKPEQSKSHRARLTTRTEVSSSFENEGAAGGRLRLAANDPRRPHTTVRCWQRRPPMPELQDTESEGKLRQAVCIDGINSQREIRRLLADTDDTGIPAACSRLNQEEFSPLKA